MNTNYIYTKFEATAIKKKKKSPRYAENEAIQQAVPQVRAPQTTGTHGLVLSNSLRDALRLGREAATLHFGGC